MARSFSNGNGPGGPYVVVLGDCPLNPVPGTWDGIGNLSCGMP
jgi:hypothetical protein